MTDVAPSEFRHPSRHVRLDTILRLRWLAVLGQLAAIFIVSQGLNFSFAVIPCLAIIGVSALINLAVQTIFNPMQRLEPVYAAVLLALNIVELAGLLFLTGGLQNPFSFLFLAPVLISATALPVRMTMALGFVAVACASNLVFYHYPLPWDTDDPLVLPPIYLFGVWLSIVLAIGVTSLYAFQVTEESRKLSDALAATELVLAREQQLHALDGLAAAAAHELGTPLSTIAVVAKELAREAPPGSNLADDIALLQSQAERCREILRKLTRGPTEPDPLHARISVRELLEEAAAPYRGFNVQIVISAAPDGDEDAANQEPVGERRPGVIYGLANLVENAVDFARQRVEITAAWSAQEIVVAICDDGPGIPPLVLDALGEPYITTRPSRRSRRGADGGEPSGMGLGFFIAKTLLERSGGTVVLENRQPPESGAIARVMWRREVFERRRTIPQAAIERRLEASQSDQFQPN